MYNRDSDRITEAPNLIQSQAEVDAMDYGFSLVEVAKGLQTDQTVILQKSTIVARHRTKRSVFALNTIAEHQAGSRR